VGKQVIFLRKLKEGGVAHSFGIHVARLAGMPREVLDSAERTLAQLEGGSTQKIYISSRSSAPAGEEDGSHRLRSLSGHTDPTRVKGRSSSSPASASLPEISRWEPTPSPSAEISSKDTTEPEAGFQLSLFQLDDPTLSAIRDKLNAADLDNMTPMQAFDLLRSMKAELGL
jgi:DNA mismatch repair protein MutS